MGYNRGYGIIEKNHGLHGLNGYEIRSYGFCRIWAGKWRMVKEEAGEK